MTTQIDHKSSEKVKTIHTDSFDDCSSDILLRVMTKRATQTMCLLAELTSYHHKSHCAQSREPRKLPDLPPSPSSHTKQNFSSTASNNDWPRKPRTCTQKQTSHKRTKLSTSRLRSSQCLSYTSESPPYPQPHKKTGQHKPLSPRNQ